MDVERTTQPETTIKLSLRWIVGGVLLLFGISIAGGIVGQQLFQQPLPPLEPGSDRLVTTVQQVTISPNERVEEIIGQAQRSVMLLKANVETEAILGTAVVVTNDGLLVTTVTVPDQVVALDDEGRAQAVNVVGRDAVFGLTFLRLRSAVVVPIDLRQGDPTAGMLLWALTQTADSYTPLVEQTRIQSHVLPTAQPVGWQRILSSTPLRTVTLAGAPVLDEEGKLAGLIWDEAAATVVPISHVQASLNRVAGNAREINPFEQLGFSVTYLFRQPSPESPAVFVAQVTTVTPESSAAAATLKRGDIITAINGEALSWEKLFVELLSTREPIRLTVQDAAGEHGITITPTI